MREPIEIPGAPPDRDRILGGILPEGNPFKGPSVEEGGPGWAAKPLYARCDPVTESRLHLGANEASL